MAVLERIAEIASEDFPEAGLTADSFNAVALGGARRKHMWGVEFRLPAGTKKPEGYSGGQSELILSGGL